MPIYSARHTLIEKQVTQALVFRGINRRRGGKSVIDPPTPKAMADAALASGACTVSHITAKRMGVRQNVNSEPRNGLHFGNQEAV